MAAEYPPRDRVSLRAYIRARHRGRGQLKYVDDDEEARSSAELVYMNCGQSWYEDALSRTDLGLEALLATTTDVPTQSIGNTVDNNGEFWSSTGTSTGTVDEALLYRIRQPLSRVAYVSVAVYRAFYQHGDPLYPPHKVSFLTGPSPNQLYPASPIYPVRLTDDVQVFALSPTAAVSQYLMVRMHGRRQRQWEDFQFYIAIRHVAAYGDLVDVSYGIQMMRLARSSGLAWPCTRGLVSAVATLGTVGENQQEQGATDGALGSDRPEDAERTCLGLPPPRRQSSAGAVHDQALAADVFTAGHMSASEALRAYVSAAMHRGPVLPYPNSEPAFPVRAGGGMQGQRHRPVLPSGPTYSELRLAVQHSGILRALPHMVKVPWPETLSVTIQRRMRPQQLQQRQSMQQVLMKFATAIGYDRSSVQGAGFQRYDGQGMRSRWRQGAAWEAAGPSAAAAEPAAFFDYPNRVWPSLRGHADFEEDLYGRPPPRRGGGDTPHDANRIGNGAYGTATAVARLAENAARRGIGSLQRLHEWVVAAAKGTSAAVGPADAGPVANIGRGGAGTQRAAVLHARECGRPFRARSTSGGSSHNGAQLLGAVSNERILSSSNRTRLQHPDDGDEQKGVDVAPDWFRGVLTPSGGDEASAAEIPAARDPSGAFYSCDARAGAMARSAVNANRNPAEAAHLHALMSTDQSSHLDSLNHNSMYATAADTDVQLKVREIRAQGDNDEIDGAAAASTSGGCIALRHTRPQQPLPPPKLRRRGYDVQKGSSAPGKVAADGDDGSEAQRRRRQRHLRAVQRAMQPALYRPYKDSALFVALDVWAGVHIYGCSSNSTARRAAAGAAGRNGDGTGCWLVSHYDHEHL